ncbi:MAG TPA: hypothetical protein VFB82_00410, partial [Blastocatellia bacterium]|nr:hypothetical protein [Blastocatellia bacterium]
TIKSNLSRRYDSRTSSIARALLVMLFLSGLLPTPPSIVPNRVMAADGELVPSFGTNGFVVTDFAGGNDAANAVAATPTGKIIAAGSATMPGTGTDFALACYDEDGSLDQSFGNGGKVTVDFFGANDGARGLAVQRDGKIVVSGFATNGTKRLFSLARFTEVGQLDAGFGQGGKLPLDLGSTSEAFKIALQGDDKILAVGDSRLQNTLDFTVIRLNPADGSLDNSFSDDGVARIDFGFTDRAIDLAIAEDNILIAGIVVKSQTDSDFGVAALDFDGSPKSNFGDDAKITTDFFLKQDGAQAIKVSGDEIIVAGFATNETSDFGVARYNRRGRPIERFGRDGQLVFDFSGSRDLAFDVINQPDGDILATGWAGIGTGFDLGVVRFDGEDGSLDSSFGLQGRFTHDAFSGTNNVAFDAMLYKNTILTAGVGLNPASGNDDWIITQHENKKFVEFTKEASPNPAVVGDIVTYTFTIKNLTEKKVTVRITDYLPEGVTFQTQDGWLRALPFDSRILRSSLIDVPAGETRKRFLRVTADQNGLLQNEASLFTARPSGFFEITDEEFLADAEVESEVKEPVITGAVVKGKKLLVFGSYGSSSGTNQSTAIVPTAIEPDAECPTILIDGQEQKTKRDGNNPSTVLIAKKGGKEIARGQTVTLKVRLCDGTETADFIFTRPE